MPNSGLEDWPFYENSRNIEPYKGQDKEEVEEEKEPLNLFLEKLEVGDVLLQGAAVVVVVRIDLEQQAFKFISSTDTKDYEKGSNYWSCSPQWVKLDVKKIGHAILKG